jgi:catechol 2,3-dioxygenase-like lactoylglutathione lyase family enzyme
LTAQASPRTLRQPAAEEILAMPIEPVLDPGSLRRFAWVVVNVTDLERSRSFYEAMTPLRTRTRVTSRRQRFGGLGIEAGSFDGYLLSDDTAGACAVQLVQWHDPAPTGLTYRSHTNPGYFRMCFQSEHVAELYEAVIDAGIEPLSPLRVPKGEHIVGRPVFCFRDPDGVVLEFVTLPGPDRLYHANCNTADLQAAHHFYQDTLGLRSFLHSTTHEPEDHSFGPGGDLATYDAHLYCAPDGDPTGPPDFAFDVVESTYPGPVGHVYTATTNVGIVRVAIEVASVDDAYEALGGRSASFVHAPPERWDLGPELGSIKTLVIESPDGAPMELIER